MITHAVLRTDSYRVTGRYGNLKLFLFGRGTDPTLEMLANLNLSASDLSLLSALNDTTFSNLNASLPVTDS